MHVVTREVTLNGRNDFLKITPLGDIHLGGKDCNLKLLRRVVAKIQGDENHFWIGMGDYVEAIMLDDKRFDAREVDERVTVAQLQDFGNTQLRMIHAELAPIRDRCLGLIMGNHDDKLAQRYFVDWHGRFCEMMLNDFGNLNLGYSAIVKLRLRRSESSNSSKLLKVYVHHGAGGGRKKGSKANRIMDLAANFPFCDIYIMGHVHDRLAISDVVLDCTDRLDTIVQIPRAYGITGCFKETYAQGMSGYGERAQYQPTALGVITFTIFPFRKIGTEEKMVINAHSGTDGMPI